MKKLFLCLIVSIPLVACQAKAEQSGGGSVTGIWVGDFGDGYFDRNTITLDLKWDGKTLAGTIKPGDPNGRMYRSFTPFPIEKAQYDPETGEIKFEALFSPRERNYVITGKVTGNKMAG